MASKSVLLLEPFCGGSHKQMTDLFLSEFRANIDAFVLSAKKWHWRSRTSALYFAGTIPVNHSYKKLFCSSVLNLTELIGLRPDLSDLKKTIYFHENQLNYPVLEEKERDFQYGYMQILSCLTADCVLFNSNYNLHTFLSKIDSFLKLIPSDGRPKNSLSDMIKPRCRLLYFPMVYPVIEKILSRSNDVLHIVWNHRWEHDKNPELFFRIIFRLKDEGYAFIISVVGESYRETPGTGHHCVLLFNYEKDFNVRVTTSEIFDSAKQRLADHLRSWGYFPNKSDYWKLLQSCHVVVSTADQEFFGISVLEATYCGCYPICPKALSYPEIYPDDCLYSTEAQLFKKLKALCKFPELAVRKRENLSQHVDFTKYSWTTLRSDFMEFLC